MRTRTIHHFWIRFQDWGCFVVISSMSFWQIKDESYFRFKLAFEIRIRYFQLPIFLYITIRLRTADCIPRQTTFWFLTNKRKNLVFLTWTKIIIAKAVDERVVMAGYRDPGSYLRKFIEVQLQAFAWPIVSKPGAGVWRIFRSLSRKLIRLKTTICSRH